MAKPDGQGCLYCGAGQEAKRKPRADGFTGATRDTVCAACGQPCRRLFRKTRDGRPWPREKSLCDLCIDAIVTGVREHRRSAESEKASDGKARRH